MRQSVYDLLPKITGVTLEEIAEEAGLDFTAVKTPLSYTYRAYNGAQVVPDKVAIVREDDGRYLGTVGTNRGLLQYRDVLKFTGALMEEAVTPRTAGIIGNGEQAFIVMQAKKQIKVGGDGEEVDLYFYVTTSHDSSKGLEIVFAPLNKVNGTVLSGSKSQRIKFRHSSKVEQRVLQAKKSIDRITTYFDEMEQNFELMRNVKLTPDQLDTFLVGLFPDPEVRVKRAETIREDIYSIYRNSPACRLPATQGSMLGAYFAVVEWVDTQQTTKKSKRRPNEYDAKIHRVLEGSGAEQKATAYAFALKMTQSLKGLTFGGEAIE